MKKDYNTAKGQQLDKDVVRLRKNIALGITKDFHNGCYQITIGFNDAVVGTDKNGKEYLIDCCKLLYSPGVDRYPIVLNDAEEFLLVYEVEGVLNFHKSNAACLRVYHAIEQEDLDQSQIDRIIQSGYFPVIIGDGHSYIHQIGPDREWSIPEEYNGSMIEEHIIRSF